MQLIVRRRRKYLWPVVTVLALPLLVSFFFDATTWFWPIRWFWTNSALFTLVLNLEMAVPSIVLLAVLIKVRQRFLAYFVAYDLYLLALSAAQNGRYVSRSESLGSNIDSTIWWILVAMNFLGLFFFAATYTGRHYSRILPFIALVTGPSWHYPYSLLWLNTIGNYTEWRTILDVLSLCGALVVVWGAVRMKETNRIPWKTVVLLIGLLIAMRWPWFYPGYDNLFFLRQWLEMGLIMFGILIAVGVPAIGAFLTAYLLRRIKGPLPPMLGPALPPKTPRMPRTSRPLPGSEAARLKPDSMYGIPLDPPGP